MQVTVILYQPALGLRGGARRRGGRGRGGREEEWIEGEGDEGREEEGREREEGKERSRREGRKERVSGEVPCLVKGISNSCSCFEDHLQTPYSSVNYNIHLGSQ